MTATTTTPERVEVEQRLRLMADQGDFGRKPDPDDIRRVAADMLKASAAEIARLEKERDEAQSWGESWRLRCKDREAETIALEAEHKTDLRAFYRDKAAWVDRALAAEAESARLREALEPFAEAARPVEHNDNRYDVDEWMHRASELNIGQFRAALRALANVSKQEVVDHG